AGTALLLNSAFKLRRGSLTFVFTLNGVLVCITKGNFYLLAVPIATGLAADAWVAWTARRPGRPSASLCAVIGAAFATAYMAEIPGMSRDGSAASDLRALLVDVIGELAVSHAPRDAESGRLLLDYYVKRVGSHDVIMERLHLSRPTYYRRLHHGFELIANRLDEWSVNRMALNDPAL